MYQNNIHKNREHFNFPSAVNMTPEINQHSIESIQAMIKRKQQSQPFYANAESVQHVITDMDHFPYNRFYRGVSYFPEPIIMEREAGWRERHDKCYDVIVPNTPSPLPNHCFEAPCSTVYPCYPEYLQKFSDREQLNVMLNRACIVQYR